MEAITLNVNAQDLINTAEQFGESGNRIANVTGEMMSLITNLSGVWTGSTSEYYISKFAALDDDIGRMLHRQRHGRNDVPHHEPFRRMDRQHL